MVDGRVHREGASCPFISGRHTIQRTWSPISPKHKRGPLFQRKQNKTQSKNNSYGRNLLNSTSLFAMPLAPTHRHYVPHTRSLDTTRQRSTSRHFFLYTPSPHQARNTPPKDACVALLRRRRLGAQAGQNGSRKSEVGSRKSAVADCRL